MKRQKGSILIFTLWVLAILAILGIVLSRRASSDVRLAKYETDNIKAAYLAKAGVMKMLSELAKDNNNYDSLNEDWNRGNDGAAEFKLGGGTVFYGASDESGRLNLNKATVEQLVRLGLDSVIAEAILRYKNAKKDKKEFEFMEELFLVEGMTRDVYSGAKDLVTIYKGEDPRVNINTANEQVLYAVIGDDNLVQAILRYRNGPDGVEGTEDDGIFRTPGDISVIEGEETGLNPSSFSVGSDIFRVWADVSFSEDKKIVKSAASVIDRTSGKIYHWKEF